MDGLTPSPNVAAIGFDTTDATAWAAYTDMATGNTVALSTSWYSPPATADDWMITPPIDIGATNVELSWRARAWDPAFPDGYQVWVSTAGATIADCMATSSIFSIASEASTSTVQTVNLTTAGFSNQAVRICFRNNSADMFLLEIDDILVQTP